MAPTGTAVRVDRNSPMADNPSRDTAWYAAISSILTSASSGSTRSPESSATGPTGKIAQPMPAPASATASGADIQNTAAPAYLTSSSRTRPAGATSRYRSVPSPASPAMVSPAPTPMVTGRNSGRKSSNAVTATKSPFWLIRSRNAGPLPGGTAEETLGTTAITTGIAARARSIA